MLATRRSNSESRNMERTGLVRLNHKIVPRGKCGRDHRSFPSVNMAGQGKSKKGTRLNNSLASECLTATDGRAIGKISWRSTCIT